MLTCEVNFCRDDLSQKVGKLEVLSKRQRDAGSVPQTVDQHQTDIWSMHDVSCLLGT